MEHARIAPSSAYRIVQCPGSVVSQAGFPDQSSTAGAEGTASHWVASEVLASFQVPEGSPLLTTDFIGKTAPNGVVITAEMVDGAQQFVTYILCDIAGKGLLNALRIEQKVAMPEIHPSECWGTPDVWAFDKKENTLYVADYKYGHKYVDEFENWQLICYAEGALNALKLPSDLKIKVVLAIVQPRFYQAAVVRTWCTQASALRPYINRLHGAAHAALAENPQIQTGPHCEYCRARHSCVGAQKAAMAAVGVTQGVELIEYPAPALADEIALLRRAKDAITFRLKAQETVALARMASGEPIPGLAARPTEGRLTWNRPVKEVQALGSMMGVDIMRAAEPMTPTQAKAKGIDDSVIKAYSYRKAGPVTLITDPDTQAKRIFGE